MKQLFFFFGFLLLCVSCTVSPKKIEYGKDACSYCDMTIVDKVHGAEIVTKKGKVFKYDAIECLIHDLTDKNEEEMAYVLVTDFLNPTTLINAKEAQYLISEKIKSPMGANLTAFGNKEQHALYKEEKFYNWTKTKKIIREKSYLKK